MSGVTEARVREVMRVQRLGYLEACAWLGRRGAAARNAAARRRERLQRVARRSAENF